MEISLDDLKAAENDAARAIVEDLVGRLRVRLCARVSEFPRSLSEALMTAIEEEAAASVRDL